MDEVTLNQIKNCDKIITELGFDKDWSRYYHNSRILLRELEGITE